MHQLNSRSPRSRGRLLVATFLLLAVFKVASSVEVLDFFSHNILSDGEVETRIFYKGVAAKETSVGRRSADEIYFRQLSDGKHIIELIYVDENEIVDCEFGHHKERVQTFLQSFKNDLDQLTSTGNITIESLDGEGLPKQFSWMNYTELRRQCHGRHMQMRKESRQRSKRDISDLFRVPGTKWCGKGYSADKYTRLGGFSKTDRCCRKHDMNCPFWIGGFETKYGLFNWRLNTLMHCNCDQRFRACLKLVGSRDANLVGKLFFNFVQTKCFVLKPKKKCVRSSWWGTCEKHKMVKQAVIRKNKPF